MVINHTINFVGVWYPMKLKIVSSKKVILLILLGAIILSLAINSHLIWTSKIINSTCYSFKPTQKLIIITSMVFIDSVIPNSVLILLNLLIIYKLRNSNLNYGEYISKSFLINLISFIFIFLPLRLLNCYILFFPIITNFEIIIFIRKLFSLLACAHYSLYFLVHFLIFKNMNPKISNFLRNRSRILKRRKLIIHSSLNPKYGWPIY